VRSRREELLPEALLDLPEVCGLPGEGGAMYLLECGEPFAVVTAEEAVEVLVGIEPKELPDDLYGEHLGVGELGAGTALTNAASLESVVDEAEDGHDEGVKIQEKTSFTPVGLVATKRREVFSLVQALKETCTQG
jgi:hypothetical protein